MIRRAMDLLGIQDSRKVIKVGDTPSDLLAGRNGGCGLTLGVTNGSHPEEELARCDHDELLSSLKELKPFLVR